MTKENVLSVVIALPQLTLYDVIKKVSRIGNFKTSCAIIAVY